MADVTISQLTQGTPSGNHLLPYSTGSSTLGACVSAIFENTNNVGIGSVVLKDKGNLQIKNGAGNSGDLIVGNMCRVGGNINQGFMDFNAYYEPTTQTGRALNSNRFAGLLSFNAVDGIVDFRITSNQQTADSTVTNLYSRMAIDSQGRVTKPFQPAFAVRADAQTLVQNSTNLAYPKISLTNEIFNIGNYWNSSSSQFVAPVAGVYSFSGMIRLNTFPGNYFYPTISINGTQYIDKYAVAGLGPLPGLVWTGGLQQSFVTTNWQQLIKLDAGDVIALNFRAYSNGTYQIDSQTVFYGYLLG
jgi:hypothetical protein